MGAILPLFWPGFTGGEQLSVLALVPPPLKSGEGAMGWGPELHQAFRMMTRPL